MDDLGGYPELAKGLAKAIVVRSARVRNGTANLADEAAMSVGDALAALDTGLEVAHDLVAGGSRCLVTGEVGIGNTTSAAALVAAITGLPGVLVAGRGVGADNETLARKVASIDATVARLTATPDPLRVLAEIGGLEIAALAGFIVGAASRRVPVLIDGAIACAALLVATELAPAAARYATSRVTGRPNRSAPSFSTASECARYSTWRCGSERARVRVSRSPSSAPPPGCSPRWPRSMSSGRHPSDPNPGGRRGL